MQWKCLWWKPLWQTYLLAKHRPWYFFLFHRGVTSIELNKAPSLKCSEHSINVRHYSLVFCLNIICFGSWVLPWGEIISCYFLVWWHLVAQLCLPLCDPMTITYQAPLSMGFPRQEYWSWLPFPSPRDLPDPEIEPMSLALPEDSLPAEPQGKPCSPPGWLFVSL